jgi:hypothetical protein
VIFCPFYVVTPIREGWDEASRVGISIRGPRPRTLDRAVEQRATVEGAAVFGVGGANLHQHVTLRLIGLDHPLMPSPG